MLYVHTMPAGSEPESIPQVERVRLFAVDEIGSRLAADPNLVVRFWDRIAAPAGLVQPDLTFLHCSVRWLGRTLTLLEFVSGETLEDLVKRSRPEDLLREIPLFCLILDAVEGAGRKTTVGAAPCLDLELIDVAVSGTEAPGAAKVHGAGLAGPDGTWDEQFFGGDGASRSQVRVLLKQTARSLSPTEAGVPTAIVAPPVPAGLLARSAASPLVIGAGTAMLVLAMLYGVGGFLAKHTVSPNAGKLMLPPVAAQPVETPVVESPPPVIPEPAADSAEEAAPARRKRADRQPVGTIVLARGARPLRQTKLLYPAEAQKERVSGVVEMQLTIAEDGSVQSPRVLSGDPLLRAGLAEQVSKWVYQPLRVNGKPVAMTTELAIRFELSP
jgi:TonB family protein